EGWDEDIYFSNITFQLRRPTLGVWNTSTREIYLGEERIDMYVAGTVQVGNDAPVVGTYLVTNLDAIFGELGSGGQLQVLGLIAEWPVMSLTFEADLDYDTLSGSPPTADHGIGSSVSAPTSSGLLISSIADASSD